MGLEEHFDISVEESSLQTIATVENAADLIDIMDVDPLKFMHEELPF
jgi:hypothetical protein